ncbi:MAG TPA: hypothetical protein VEQ41_09690 [Solirubrobacterales bacterium]|nr:hypothetical protein [Solirubrobacterales bacterium]
MSMKLKVLGLGLIAAMAMGSFAVLNASASVSGHFTHDAAGGHAIIKGLEGPGTAHRVKFSTGGTPIECDEARYEGTVSSSTVTTLDVLPIYSKCHTEGAAAGSVVVDVRGCTFRFHSNSGAAPHTPATHATTGLVCPAGVDGILVTHPNCTMRMPPQALSGVTYTTTVENNKHAITLNATVGGITAHYESGICIFLGTKQTGTMNGSATVWAENTAGERVNITAT